MTQMTDQRDLPTLADVARMANVSTATVSRCLNSPDKVGKTTRETVMNAVNALGYSPNFGARALAAKRTNTVGAVIPTMDNAIFARGLQAFEEELNSLGMTLLVASSNYLPDREEEQIKTLVARGADALLLIGYDRDPSVYEFLARQSIPMVIAWAYQSNSSMHAIGFDNRAAVRSMTHHILDLGHKRLGFISAPQSTNDRARERVLGARDALTEKGFAPSALSVVEMNYSISNGGTALAELLRKDTDITAVLCGNDVLAVGALKMAKKLGLSVPRDLSITGFDDIEISTIADPEITTVHVPHRQMGRKAAQYLAQFINDKSQPEAPEPLETVFYERGTLAPPRDPLGKEPRL